jgi:biopolymer transport protein ExbD
MDDFYKPVVKQGIHDLSVVPILDMFISLIFFLVLSISFIPLTKLTIPPSGISKITEPLAPPPLSPKLLVKKKGSALIAELRWEGREPGRNQETWNEEIWRSPESLVKKVSELLEKSRDLLVGEKTLQISLSAETELQVLISVMDGSRAALPDIVLNSNAEADAL